MSLVYWDSMLFVYLLERNPRYFSAVTWVHDAMRRRGDTLCTSIFTVGEVLVGPRRMGSHSGADRILDFFAAGTIRLLPYTIETANQYALVRAWTRAKPPDSVHIASAALAQADIFLTNDEQLQSLQIPGIGRIAGLDLSLLKKLLQ